MTTTLQTTQIHTPIGDMLAVADNKCLYLLTFLDNKKLITNLNKLSKATGNLINLSKDVINKVNKSSSKSNCINSTSHIFTNTHNSKNSNNKVLISIYKDLQLYFSGKLKKFTTPINLLGSGFQKKAWRALLKVPYGKTASYSSQATKVGDVNAYRAVANANGKNNLTIIVPCHRIIRNNGSLGGYGGGVDRKIWLLRHEAQNF